MYLFFWKASRDPTSLCFTTPTKGTTAVHNPAKSYCLYCNFVGINPLFLKSNFYLNIMCFCIFLFSNKFKSAHQNILLTVFTPATNSFTFNTTIHWWTSNLLTKHVVWRWPYFAWSPPQLKSAGSSHGWVILPVPLISLPIIHPSNHLNWTQTWPLVGYIIDSIDCVGAQRGGWEWVGSVCCWAACHQQPHYTKTCPGGNWFLQEPVG